MAKNERNNIIFTIYHIINIQVFFMFYITLEHIMYFSYGIKVTHLNTSENFEEKKYQHPVDELG